MPTEQDLEFIGLNINQSNLSFSWGHTPVPAHPGIVIHYFGNGRLTEDTRNPAEVIHAIHKGNGWPGIGYHGVVHQNGKYYTGRPYRTRGAHCAQRGVVDLNHWFGLHWYGGVSDKPTPEAIDTLAKVIAWVALYEGFPIDRKHVIGHFESGIATSCPGPMKKHLNAVVARAHEIAYPKEASLDTNQRGKDAMTDEEHWAYELAKDLHGKGLIQGKGKNPDGSPFFGLSQPADYGQAMAMAYQMVKNQEKLKA